MKASQIRVMIVDDHAVIRAGLRMLIEHDQTMSVVAMAGTRSEALSLAASSRPDIIILDLILGEDDGHLKSGGVDRRAKSRFAPAGCPPRRNGNCSEGACC